MVLGVTLTLFRVDTFVYSRRKTHEQKFSAKFTEIQFDASDRVVIERILYSEYSKRHAKRLLDRAAIGRS